MCTLWVVTRFALTSASRLLEEQVVLTMLKGSVLIVDANLLQTNTQVLNTVKSTGISKIEFDGFEDVYNMEVEDNHNYSIEGGLIVHNCMDATRYFVATEGLVDKNEQTYNDEELKKLYDPRNEYQDDYIGGIF